ncbi:MULTISPECIES: HIT family protein [Pseudomonas]|uniref:HIT family hydrolase, diadenosine tetraphosphate hydrolase n=1 Tax=Pseudomonas asplenii TaxID=53407 RepID=A0A0M9GHS9_9PSED|nr:MULTISPECIES: HIT family protein [Pseudomonas]KPA91323.1 HIT family hydrolase, diadenosine tetraphosphate hydrolase [Pseudomonas fuscovaginae]
MNCIFCAIVAKLAPASIVHEDEQCLAFLSIQPITPGHVLVIPKAHASGLGEIPPETAGHMMVVGQRVATALRNSGLRLDGQPCEGINLLLCDGAVAGQTVGHAHLHVIARFVGDGFDLAHGDIPLANPQVLGERAELIRSALEQR